MVANSFALNHTGVAISFKLNINISVSISISVSNTGAMTAASRKACVDSTAVKFQTLT